AFRGASRRHSSAAGCPRASTSRALPRGLPGGNLLILRYAKWAAAANRKAWRADRASPRFHGEPLPRGRRAGLVAFGPLALGQWARGAVPGRCTSSPFTGGTGYER